LKQDGSSVSKFYTKMKCVCKELDAMVDLLEIIEISAQIIAVM